MGFVVAAFYHFTDFPNYVDMKDIIKEFCEIRGIRGTILLSSEGINSTVSGTEESIAELRNFLLQDLGFNPLESWKEAQADFLPFRKTKVRLKKELVAFGVSNLDMSLRGEYVDPVDWDDLISSEDVFLIDTRNDYEIKYGTFDSAIDPKTTTFREFPTWMEDWAVGKDKKSVKVAMVCTGGIRCEKSTAYVKSVLGFENVYHLKGGILGYFEKLGSDKTRTWKGSCFVFDDRVAVSNSLVPVDFVLCVSCGSSIDRSYIDSFTKSAVFCPQCAASMSVAGECSGVSSDS